MYRLVLLLLFLISLSSSSKILFINTWHSKSHMLTMSPVAESSENGFLEKTTEDRLVERNHSVTMYNLAFSELGKSGKGVEVLTSIVTPDQVEFDMAKVADLFWNEEMTAHTYFFPSAIGTRFLKHSMDSEAMHTVLSTPWDIVIMDELFAGPQGAIAKELHERYGSKLIVFATTEFYDLLAQYRGLGRNPTVVPNHYVRGYDLRSDVRQFYYRLQQSTHALLELIFLPLVDWTHRIAGQHMGVKTDLADIYKNSLATLTDFPRSLRRPTTTSHALVPTGESCRGASPLPSDLREFVEDPSSKGTIYVAFGSLVQWDQGPKELPEVFIRAFNQLSEYRIIWVYSGRQLQEKLGNHIRITKWAPQNDLLAHKNTAVFFTHGGLKSLKEGICAGVPLLVMPFFADQMLIATAAVEKRLALNIYKKNATEIEITSKLRQVLSNASEMKKTVTEYRSVFLDNIIDPVLEGALRVEKLIRVDEEKYRFYTRIRGVTQSWIEYLYIDIGMMPLSLIYVLSK